MVQAVEEGVPLTISTFWFFLISSLVMAGTGSAVTGSAVTGQVENRESGPFPECASELFESTREWVPKTADFAELRTTSGAHTLVQILIMRPQAGEVELISRRWELNQGYLDCAPSQEFSKRLKEVAGLPPLAEIWDRLMALEVSVWPSTNRGRQYAQFHSSSMMNSTFFGWETNGVGTSGIEIADFWEPIQDALFARELMASSQ